MTFIPLLSLLCSGTLSEGLSDVFNAECISPHQGGLSYHKLHYSTLCITHYTTLQNNIFCLPSCHLSFCQYHQNHQGQMSLLPQYFQAMKEYVTISEHYSQGINLKVKQSSGQSAKLSMIYCSNGCNQLVQTNLSKIDMDRLNVVVINTKLNLKNILHLTPYT